MKEPLLKIENLKTHFYTYKGVVRAVDGINLEIKEDEILGLVGESGCGKTVTALSILKLLSSNARIVEGKIIFEGLDIVSLKEEGLRNIRGSKIAMIFQEPMSSLNPVYTIGNQLVETVLLHNREYSKKQAREKAIELLKLVKIPLPEKVIDQYPHELSGGMRQRCMIAMALVCKPKLLIADEPTTALDVTTESQILELIKELKSELHHSVLLITHDLGIVAELCDRVAVMYAGKIVECSDVKTIFTAPKHPYTIGLLNAIPKFTEKRRLEAIEGMPPDLISLPKGCRFAPRCKFATSECKEREPELRSLGKGHEIACFKIIENVS
ncbi:MAG: ABC transporter ATP-binding protein [Candidatus Thermoplasmatota archaeon]|nr:ABC transporter ATP-binding protein [Candidatus Thermoplasmatota archaeon]